MKAHGLTHIGLVRHKNQDSFFMSEEKIGNLDNLYIVADGMGGHKAGEIASLFSVKYFLNYIKDNNESDLAVLLKDGTRAANRGVYTVGKCNLSYEGMGTTFVAATIKNNVLHVVNVGDSRLYIYSDKLSQVTLDHSRVEELYRAGLISEEERIDHPNKNQITRAIGMGNEIEVDSFQVDLTNIKYVLLCTDGLTKMLTDGDIESYFDNFDNLESTMEKIMKEVNDRGGYDNTTIIIIDLNSEVADGSLS